MDDINALVEGIAMGILALAVGIVAGIFILGFIFFPLIVAIATHTWWVGLFGMMFTISVVITEIQEG